LADQYYIEEGYLADDYFVYVADAQASLSVSSSISCDGDIADTTGYYIPDYIAEGYFVAGTTQEASASLSASFSTTATGLRIKPGDSQLDCAFTQTTDAGKVHSTAEIAITSAFAPSITVFATRAGDIDLVTQFAITADADRSRSTDVTLSNIVNLSLQADRSRASSASVSSSISITTTPDRLRASGVSLSSAFSISAITGELEQGASLAAGAFNLTANGGYLLETSSALDSAFTQPDTYAISYVLRANPYDRPINLDDTHGNFSFDINNKAEGTHSLKVTNGETARTTESDFFEIGENGEFYLDFYFRYGSFGSGNTTPTILSYGYNSDEDITNASGVGFQIGFSRLDSNYQPDQIQARIPRSGQSDIVLTSNISYHSFGYHINPNEWYRITFRREYRAAISNYLWGLSVTPPGGGASVASDSETNASAMTTPNDPRLYFISTNNNHQFDYLRFNRGEGNLWTTTSGNPYILDFNNEGVDELWFITHEGAADLDTAFTLSADPSFKFDSNANITSEFSISADVNEITQGSATLDSQASISATATRIKQLDAALNATFSTTCDFDRLRSGASGLNSAFAQNSDINVKTDTDSTLASAFAQTATGVRIHPGEATLNALYSEITVINKIGNTLVSIDTAFTQTTDPVKTTDTDATLDAVASLSSEAVRTRPFDSALSSSFGITADLDRIRTSDIESYFENDYIDTGYFSGGIQVFLNMSVIAGIIEDANATIPSAFSLSADVGEIEQGEIDLSTAITISTAGDRVRFAEATLDGAFTPSITAVATKVGETTLDAEFTATTEGDRIRFGEANITGAFTPIIDVNAQLLGEINLATAFTIELEATQIFANRLDETARFDITIDAVKTAAGEATLNSVVEIDRFIGGAKFVASADISTAFTVEVDAKIIHVDQYVFDIHREYRTYTIPSEDRSFTIHAENRLASITSEDRLQDIYEEARTTTVEG